VLTGALPGTPWLVAWFAVIAALGVCAAIPIKRQLVNVEQLAFPSGVATAETIRSLHALGEEGEGSRSARRLGVASLLGAVVALLRDLKVPPLPVLPDKIPFGRLAWGGHPAAKWSVAIEGSLLLVGAGAIMGMRTCASMLAGALLDYVVLAPWLLSRGIARAPDYKVMVTSTLWPAAAMMLAHGLASFAFEWRSVARTFSGLGRVFQRRRAGDLLEEVECPAWWFPAGYLVLGPIVVALMVHLFGVPLWAAILALPLSFVMGIVAARVTGETDVTPTKALGPATQLVYGALVPGNLTANVMGANVTGGVGLHAADLLTDLKSGYLLGASPRQQFLAQLFGVLAGAAAVVPVFRLLVPTPDVLGSPELPAPGVQVWAGVSKALAYGIGGLHPALRSLALVGAVIGLVLAVVEKTAPRHVRAWVPSASAFGVGMVIPGSNSIAMFLGAALAWGLARRNPKLAEAAVVPVASGLIAGESLMGILIKALAVLGVAGR
jgi:uncharacterized oligopeptide transporter (OPT) family protein